MITRYHSGFKVKDSIIPSGANATDIGSPSLEFKDLYVSGLLYDGTGSQYVGSIINHIGDVSNPHVTTLQQATDSGSVTTTPVIVGSIIADTGSFYSNIFVGSEVRADQAFNISGTQGLTVDAPAGSILIVSGGIIVGLASP